MHIDMRQIRELLKEDFVESMLQADQGESEEMKVLELKDVVSDLNGLCQMLMEDRFKHITAWDGEPDLDFYKVRHYI